MLLSKQFLILLLSLFTCVSYGQLREDSLFFVKSELIFNHVADSIELPVMKIRETEKLYWSYVIARIEKHGLVDQEAIKYIPLLLENESTPYSLAAEIRLLYRYPDCPEVRTNMQMMIKKVFDRTDSKNTWTGEGTESQVGMLRTSGYLFAQKAFLYGDYFKDAPQKLDEMKKWILDWSSRIYEVGTGEFNSGFCQVNNLAGWLNLFDFADDEEVRLAARAVLDYYAAEMALHYSFGYVGGVEMRGVEIENIDQSAYFYLNWLWFSPESEISLKGDNLIELIYPLLSNYRPPSILVKYAQRKPKEAEWYLNSKPTYLLDKASLNKHFYYRTPNFTMGCQVSAYGGWTNTSSQIVNWKLIVSNKDTISEVRGNGSYRDSYSAVGRDPWTQWTQYENVLIQLTKVPENGIEAIKEIDDLCENWNNKWKHDFNKRFEKDNKRKGISTEIKNLKLQNKSYLTFPGYLKFSQKNDVWFVDFGTAYMAVVGVPAYQPTSLLDYKERKILLVNNELGKICGFAIEVVDAKDYESYDDFQRGFVKGHIMYIDSEMNLLTYESIRGKHFEMLYQEEGTSLEPVFDWGYGIKTPQINQHQLSVEQPDWPNKIGTGKIPVFLADNHRYDFDEDWPVFSGPVINLDQSILNIEFNGIRYRVDYSSRLPVFTE